MKVFPLSLPLTVLIYSSLYGKNCEVVGDDDQEMNGGVGCCVELPAESTDRL